MSFTPKDLKNLARYGSNVLDVSPNDGVVTPLDVMQSILNVLSSPNARAVGAVAQALLNLSTLSVELDELYAAVMRTSHVEDDGVHRLGYMSERLASTRRGDEAMRLRCLAEEVAAHLETCTHEHRLIALAGTLRRRDKARKPDDVIQRWGVTSRPELINEYVHDAMAHAET